VFLSWLFVQVVVIKYPEKDDPFIPVRSAGAMVRHRVNGDAVSSVYPNGPGGWIVDDPLKVQPGVKGVFLEKGERVCAPLTLIIDQLIS